MNQDNSTRFWGFAVAAVTLLALALRLTGIDGPSFKIWDDFFVLRQAVKDYSDILHSLVHQPFDAYQEYQPPLYYMIVHAFLGLGKTDAMARMACVIAGTLTIPAVYCLGRRLLGRPAGLIAALLLAVSIYHIEYSQQIRNYTLFLCLAVWSMNFLAAWILERDRRALLCYVPVTAAMLYTSYMSTAALASQLALCAVFFLLECRNGFGRAVKEYLPLAAVLAVAAAAYLPWLPNFYSMYSVLARISGNVRPPVLESLAVALREFSSYYNDVLGYPDSSLYILGLALAGAVAALLSRPRRAVWLLGWAGVTLLIVFGFNRQGLHVRPRHLIILLPILYLFCGYSLSLLAGRFKRPAAGAAAVLAVILLLNAFNFRAMPFFYRRQDDRLKDLSYTLATFKRDTNRQFFWGSDSKWFPDVNEFVQNWYLPDVFKRPDQEFSREYLRAWMVSTPGVRQDLEALENVAILGRRGFVDYALAGIVNISPMVLEFDAGGRFVHKETFATPLSFGLLHDLDNILLDKGKAILRDLTRPGQATWALALPEGGTVSSVRVDFTATFWADVSGIPGSAVNVSVAGPDGAFTPLARVSFRELAASSNFDGRQLALGRGVDIPDHLCRDGLRLRLELDPGPDLGTIAITSVTISAVGRAGANTGKSPARMRLEHALANTPGISFPDPAEAGSDPVRKEWSGNASIPTGRPLSVFTTLERDPFDPARIGGMAALSAFRKEHPGLKPVLTLEDGTIRYFLFDPALAAPAQPVPGRYVLDPPAHDGRARSVSAWGLMPGAAISLDGKVLPLASAGAEPAYVDLDGAGSGRLVLTPLFVKGGPVAPGAAEAEGLKQKIDEDCLTCVDAKPCRLIYKLSAPGGFTSITLRAYPRVFGDWKLHNGWRASVSTDGRAFERLDTLRSNASGRWDGWRVPRSSRKNWSLPQRDIYLLFELSGDGAQLWSSSEYPMFIQADFSARDASLPLGHSLLDASGRGGRIQLLDSSPADFKHLLLSH